MNWWFLLLILFAVLGLGYSLAKDGEPIKSEYSFWRTLISYAIQLTITYFAIKQGF